MVSTSTHSSPNSKHKKVKSIYEYPLNSTKLSTLEINLKELAEESIGQNNEEQKETVSTWASTQGSPDNPLNGSVINEMFIKHYAEAKPICFLKTKSKKF